MCSNSNRLIDSIEYTQYAVFDIKRKITLIIADLQLWDFFVGTQERVRISHGIRVISVRATEVLLYYLYYVTVVANIYQQRYMFGIKKDM